MKGWHGNAGPPDRNAICDQPVAQAGDEIANMLAGESLLYKPLNMIVNFRTSAWDREPGMTVFATKARQHEPQIRAEKSDITHLIH
ncbi:hypothetical protein [Rhizobium leguminosarum]|uniref:hypothetical protein n=1 Tax=Rhizobium leguminosarum TaxID=384 RepID=UPI00039E20DC|nr:hypothetical protein [Rhizobium leguminosarum]MBB4344002.1 hypothetical protein [Rhizobium leguminosarum]MBB4464742.1 hypothetical protein [Rhizobium leguminosarum]MBB4471095.1 hypothetical protein [Rhizobium leguminosarum]MBY5501788.1 hypothetical protein [Rhizobium leguminosarum]UIK09340.1 hypothetical protein LZK80_14830 [Rhizobium leguminosarum]